MSEAEKPTLRERRLISLIRRLIVASNASSSDDTFGGGLSYRSALIVKAMRKAVGAGVHPETWMVLPEDRR